MSESLLSVRDLVVHFATYRGVLRRRQIALVRAVDGVSFDVGRGETLGLVGESGCGKSTTARAVLQLIRPTAGTVRFAGEELTRLWRASHPATALRAWRRRMQIVFQDPYASLNPRMTLEAIVGEPLRNFNVARGDRLRQRVQDLLREVGLDPAYIRRYPHELSGGQRQRVGIARALALEPELLVLDEPVSALDVSIQAQVLNLLSELQVRLGLTYIFVAHDLAVVRHLSTRVAVMYLGRIVEIADRDALYRAPRHPYTQALIASVLIPDPERERARRRVVLRGEVPSPLAPPSGCAFHPRCPIATERCQREAPPLNEVQLGHAVACFFADAATAQTG